MSNRYYSDDDYSEDNNPLLDRPRISNSSNNNRATGLPHPEAHLLQKRQQQRIIWIPTFFFSLLYMIVTMIVCTLCVFTNLWLSFGIGIGLIVLGRLIAPFGKFAYKKVIIDNKSNIEWLSTLRSTIVIGAIIGAIAAILSGYFYRNIYQADVHTRYNIVDPTKHPVLNIGTIEQWKDAGTVAPQYAGRSVSFGLYPICVAPVLDKDASTTTINYWAISSGRCCASTPPNCGSWDLTKDNSDVTKIGAIRSHYHELTPNYQKAMDNTISTYKSLGFTNNPQAKVVIFGNPKTLKDNYKWKAATSFSILTSTSILIIFIKSRWGIYE